jgi:rifampicin phosphotransferase
MESVDLVLPFSSIHASDLPLVGGKGANLGELTNAGFPVPDGFCVTTRAFEHFMANATGTDGLYTQLEALDPEDTAGARTLSGQWKNLLRGQPVPPEVAQAVLNAWSALGTEHAYAVRSSATAEDLPDASFAGQQDSYLNVRGETALLEAVRDCWASLFNDRAILYRQRLGVGHRDVSLAVVVQRMVASEVSGILFTADPLTGNRTVASIDASFGLGEALVAGMVNADAYRVDRRTRRVLERRISDKTVAIQSVTAGGTVQVNLGPEQRNRAALTDAQALDLVDLGARVEAHYGAPQDIEWALTNGVWSVLQARPITTLFPLPEPRPKDDDLHAYISFSHVQVMTDAMPPLASSIWKLLFPFGRNPVMLENPLLTTAGGRLYVDASYALRHPLLRRVLPRAANNIDASIGGMLSSLVNRPEFAHGPRVSLVNAAHGFGPIFKRVIAHLLWPESGPVAAKALERVNLQVRQVEERLNAAGSLEEKLDLVMRELTGLLGGIRLTLAARVMAGILSDALLRRLGMTFADRADLAALTPGLQGNVTTEMGLALGDLADAAREFPDLATQLRRTDLNASERLRVEHLPGGSNFLSVWRTFLKMYGARGPSEIDLSRPRWRENPTSLLNMLAGNLTGGSVGAHRTRAAHLADVARSASERVLRAAGPVRGPIVRHLMQLVSTYLPLREHPKFLIVRVFEIIKPVLLEAGDFLSRRGQLEAADDAWLLTLPELRAVLANPNEQWRETVASRRRAFEREARLTPPRAMTSDGEQVRAVQTGTPLPAGALAGQAVSAGVVEGIVRVLRRPDEAILHPGEILVAPFTDPAWTPLFMTAAGLVTEVGGLMTHGSLVAREYGIPAVVSVTDATQLLKTGQRVRVNGDLGFVEVLEDS